MPSSSVKTAAASALLLYLWVASAAAADVLRCRFKVRVANTRPGDSVVMLPASEFEAESFASSGPRFQLTTTEDDFPWWSTEVLVPADCKIDYRFAICDAGGRLRVKPGANRVRFDFSEARPRGAPVRTPVRAPGRAQSWRQDAPRAPSLTRKLDDRCYVRITPAAHVRGIPRGHVLDERPCEGAGLRLRGGGTEVVRCKFKVRVPDTQPGDKVFMLPAGSLERGSYPPTEDAYELTTTEQDFPWWKTEVLAPVGNKLAYEFAIAEAGGGFRLKPGTNRLSFDSSNGALRMSSTTHEPAAAAPSETQQHGRSPENQPRSALGRVFAWLAQAADALSASSLLINMLLALVLALTPLSEAVDKLTS